MSAQEFSPAPWTSETSSTGKITEVRDAQGIPLATVWRDLDPGQLTKKQMDANERLFVHAPELLQALDELVDYVRREIAVCHPDLPKPTAKFILCNAEKAIAKAKGEKEVPNAQ